MSTISGDAPSATAPMASSGSSGAPSLRTSATSSGAPSRLAILRPDGHAAARQCEHQRRGKLHSRQLFGKQQAGLVTVRKLRSPAHGEF